MEEKYLRLIAEGKILINWGKWHNIGVIGVVLMISGVAIWLKICEEEAQIFYPQLVMSSIGMAFTGLVMLVMGLYEVDRITTRARSYFIAYYRKTGQLLPWGWRYQGGEIDKTDIQRR